jgi:1,4-alpha-glucan branching enzyme
MAWPSSTAPLYEHADPREGFHQDWNTLIYNYGRTEVRNYLASNALYWIERFGIDGLRVDAVASMLYRDYSRKAGRVGAQPFRRAREPGGDRLPAPHEPPRRHAAPRGDHARGGIHRLPGVSRPPSPDLQGGGLGFHYKWNMGWMNDTLAYLARDPVHRRHHHDQLRFSLVYAFSENFVLPLSHDEVVHGKGSLLGKMPGDELAEVRQPAPATTASCGASGQEAAVHGLRVRAVVRVERRGQPVRDLNRVLRHEPALHRRDVSAEGFDWISHDDAEHSLLVFQRRALATPGAGGLQLHPGAAPGLAHRRAAGRCLARADQHR